MKIIYLILILTFTGICNGYCQLKVEAGTKYQKTDGSYSDYYFRQITLSTGVELNKATETQNYDVDADYALIWFNQDEVAIIKLNIKFPISFIDRITGESINRFAFNFLCEAVDYEASGTDQDGDKWKFCFRTGFARTLCS